MSSQQHLESTVVRAVHLGGEPKALGRRWLLQGLRQGKWILAAQICCTLLASACGLLFIIGLQRLVDALTVGGDLGRAVMLIGVSTGLGLLANVLLAGLKIAGDRVIGAALATSLYEPLLGVPHSRSLVREPGDILARLQEANKIQGAATDALTRTSVELTFFLAAAAYAYGMSPLLTALAGICFPLSFLVARLSTRALAAPVAAALERQSSYQSALMEVVVNREQAQQIFAHTFWQARLSHALSNVLSAGDRVGRINVATRMSSLAIARVTELLVVLAGTQEVVAGRLTAGQLLAFVVLLFRLTNPLMLLASLSDAWKQAEVSLARIGDLWGTNSAVSAVKAVDHERGALRVADLRLPHGPPETGLSVADLRIPRGSRVHLGGPVGAGKTSFMRCMAGLLSPDGGEISLGTGGDAVQPRIYYCPAEPFLAGGTLRDNIHCGRPLDDAAIHRTARQVGLERLLAELPHGLDTRLDVDRAVSAGQRQAIALLRVLIEPPDVLLLDEATCHLDAGTESAVLWSLCKLPGLRTVIVAGHRPVPENWPTLSLTISAGRLLMAAAPCGPKLR